jgi:hypothetical protein
MKLSGGGTEWRWCLGRRETCVSRRQLIQSVIIVWIGNVTSCSASYLTVPACQLAEDSRSPGIMRQGPWALFVFTPYGKLPYYMFLLS